MALSGTLMANDDLAVVALWVTIGLYVARFLVVGALRWFGMLPPPEPPPRRSARENTQEDEQKAGMFLVLWVLIYFLVFGVIAAASWVEGFVDGHRKQTAAVVVVAGYFAVRACIRWAHSPVEPIDPERPSG
jgi:hypothetical protein